MSEVDSRLEHLARLAAVEEPIVQQTEAEREYAARCADVLASMRVTFDEYHERLVARNDDNDVLEDRELARSSGRRFSGRGTPGGRRRRNERYPLSSLRSLSLFRTTAAQTRTGCRRCWMSARSVVR